ncbi:MAG: 5-amino-6-(D-ribitylamino)uracil--L-tyrosine 4-hydroxyphenyl transferase CofH [Pseudomonadales bacterium]|jgi:FO synthase|nr:7,8-didemethyl-8-hydroxy-5-deazariboflavin synthase [Acidiferrobacteraceae bacterium]MDP6375458.1 5-amino-6-(D-ribitylamino)uracil--L-tyrosine 4-hydroxyphenyl transferase CofH [Pseudomonadales bacterium]MDP6470637.1 5-amino-6-(D-ribitylamino)uracil--L-tyrosine 4-hydroxyphenyl transferase CofH [Pseudomonadales bacterium]MDP6828507.1 5-amino-6-(D-ribitylamino)uracil--L-tyrosine 4-hydroxyphenyl transferase CofH [Pseudomonadales bacterium]MDP6970508.1 5-amino-6-(D-ribitylamino)uracil--L-tyrosine
MLEAKTQQVLDKARAGELISDSDALCLATCEDTAGLATVAAHLRDTCFHNIVTYSRKVFIPLTHLCRDVCHYCTFAQVPRKLKAPYLTLEEVLDIAREGAAMGCKEALFTLGEKPEQRYRTAREALDEMGFETTLDYLLHCAQAVYKETGLLPHANPGTMTPGEIEHIRAVSPSMGIMLESVSERLCEKGMPHYGSPDKIPVARLQTLEDAGALKVPFTTGILIGIGETRRERIESLLAIREIHERHGHVQEIIVQNFRAKPETRMAQAPEPDLDELLWSIAVTRLIFGANMSVQAPPNLSPGVLPQIVDAGINDWGGVSPLTPDFVNPEAPWPHVEELARATLDAGKDLEERLTIYPHYVRELETWVANDLHESILNLSDADGFPRTDTWAPGEPVAPPQRYLDAIQAPPERISADIETILDKARSPEQSLTEAEIVRLFKARGEDFGAVVHAANSIRKQVNGDTVTYVVNRNINYTNICYFKCQFCAFSKGKLSENLRGHPYDLSHEEIQRRTREAWDRGATEVCMQGGIHPEYTGQTYIEILQAVKEAVPDMHVHSFSPLEVWQGAATSNLGLEGYLVKLKEAGLDTLPGTAAEILDDEVREIICADKINTQQWLEVMETAHEVGFKSTATIMYGHVEHAINWARHLIRIRDLQKKTVGFTEFVPLPFVHMEAPMYLKGKARKGPTFREAVLMHAVARLALHPWLTNIQSSWVKMGHQGVVATLNAGCNDLGGTLMNESISRAAGTLHGQETNPQQMMDMIRSAGRIPKQRSTTYGEVSAERVEAGLNAPEITDIINTPARRYERGDKQELVRPGLIDATNAG